MAFSSGEIGTSRNTGVGGRQDWVVCWGGGRTGVWQLLFITQRSLGEEAGSSAPAEGLLELPAEYLWSGEREEDCTLSSGDKEEDCTLLSGDKEEQSGFDPEEDALGFRLPTESLLDITKP